MPSVFIMGNFSVQTIIGDVCRVKLTPRKSTLTVGDYINAYGKLELSRSVSIPEITKFLELCGTTLYTSLYINDKLLGEEIRSPYI